MKRTAWFRLVTALWGIWFAAALVGPPALHACPAERGASEAAAAGRGAMHHGHTAHVGETEQSAGGGPAHRSHGDHAECNCIGLGCCAAAIAAPATPVVRAREVLVATAAPLCSARPIALARRAYALPFANGPPAI